MGRVIFLVDMNAFYVSCEMARNPKLKGSPAAVAGDPKQRSGIVLTANYEARKFGVKTTMVLHEAKKLCPNIIFIPPDRKLYETNSKAVMDILYRYTPAVEQNSIDEAWMDLTGSLKLFGEPMNIAKRIMSDIQNELDLWCSIGISENKFLAKMASEIKKPLGITELWEKDIKQKLWPMPIRNLYGIGKQTETKLLALGIHKIGDLASYDRRFLVKKFGKYGEEIYLLANGIDNSVVLENSHSKVKSIGRSTTLPKDITDIEEACKVIMYLAEEVGTEVRVGGERCKTIQISIKYGDFKSITRQITVAPTYLTKDIYHSGISLLKKNWDSTRPVRLLGISVSEFESDSEEEQLSLFSSAQNASKKEEKLEKTIDILRQKFGMNKIGRAALMNTISNEKP